MTLAELSNEVIFIVGPTGTGKSDFAVAAAGEKNAVIFNIDSVQTFQHVLIGAAKPTREMREKVPHFLFDIVEPPHALTAGDYRRLALPLLEEKISQHHVFFVGGSGFYVQALEHGMFEVPEVPKAVIEELERDMKEKGNEVLWRELKERDPESAQKIHMNDSYRIKRALSLIRAHGFSISEARRAFESSPENKLSHRYRLRKVGLNLPRERLRERVTLRTRKMLELGLVDEVKGLLQMGLEDWAPLKSVGYVETVKYLRGELPESALVDEIVKSTMALAKRQVTWFKRDPEIRWFNAETEADLAKEYLLSL